ncbi:MAG: 23S rRNA (pseudouridine(1915)-N(3))-methyltransferase RlmH [Peptococcaceae bacterium]|jgi:23S rRNA (pseudouridine1915-N3)-methyltransferase|nr:23S rRNA (pseudouridine(1915)-N(3))-methyltransferase RlmH [Peptococcaceae bacterium]
MSHNIVCVGKIKEKYLQQGIDEYVKRLGPYTKLQILEVPDEPVGENLSAASLEIAKNKEGEKILSKIPPDSFVIVLDSRGKNLSSTELSEKLDNLAVGGQSRIVWVIGGSCGCSQAILDRADYLLSFGRQTFPHQLMRMILLEQIYRAFRISRNEPYHK